MKINLQIEEDDVQLIIDHLNNGTHRVVRSLIDSLIAQKSSPQEPPATDPAGDSYGPSGDAA
jgi:hypothetical protein